MRVMHLSEMGMLDTDLVGLTIPSRLFIYENVFHIHMCRSRYTIFQKIEPIHVTTPCCFVANFCSMLLIK